MNPAFLHRSSFLLLVLLARPLDAQDPPAKTPPAVTPWQETLASEVYKPSRGPLPYRLFAPKVAAGNRLPLVVFLHGAGERGADNRAQLRHGVKDFVDPARQAKHACFVLAPQCPKGVWWMDKSVYPSLIELVGKILAAHPIDPDRVYLTGLSMGGYGTWHALARDSSLFAAALPICGGGNAETEKLLADPKLAGFPVWAFHGEADPVVPIEQSRTMLAALAKAGNKAQFTTFPDVRHNSWTRTYADPKVHTWLFEQVRPVPPRPLSNGDRVVFFGDSITAAAVRPKGYIKVFEGSLRERRPKLEVTCVGAGISGNRVPDLQARVDADVLAAKPSVVVIYIGINDVWHWNNNRGTKKQDFEAGLRSLLAKIRAAGARPILCTPSVIGEKTDGSNKFDPMLAEYAEISRRVARSSRTQLLDLRSLFLAYLTRHNPENLAKGILTSDSVHLNEAGNRFVAERMLEALGVPAPK